MPSKDPVMAKTIEDVGELKGGFKQLNENINLRFNTLGEEIDGIRQDIKKLNFVPRDEFASFKEKQEKTNQNFDGRIESLEKYQEIENLSFWHRVRETFSNNIIKFLGWAMFVVVAVILAYLVMNVYHQTSQFNEALTELKENKK